MANGEAITTEMTDAAARWITAREAGTMNASDEAELAGWLAADPRHARAYARVESFWAALGSEPVRSALRHSELRLPPARARPPHRRRHALALTACLAIVVAGTAVDWQVLLQADARTGTGERRTVALADGSTVHLNTGSAIAIDYTGDARQVRLLRGEAAFAVTADLDRPFTVMSGNGSATALGTRFLVRKDGDETLVTVTEHRVRVAPNMAGAARSIVAQGQAVQHGSAGMGPIHDVDAAMAEAWQDGTLVFIDRPLAEVVRELNRYHVGHIGILGSGLAARRISGGFSIAEPDRAVDILEQTLGIKTVRLTRRLVLFVS